MRSNSRQTRESPVPVPETQSAFHPRAQRNAFRRRDVRQQRRLFALLNPLLRHSPLIHTASIKTGTPFSPVFNLAREQILHFTLRLLDLGGDMQNARWN